MMDTEDDCPHCSPSHGSPVRCSWGVHVGSDVDGDGQPTYLVVQPTDGAHVAPADARWIKSLIDAWPAADIGMIFEQFAEQILKYERAHYNLACKMAETGTVDPIALGACAGMVAGLRIAICILNRWPIDYSDESQADQAVREYAERTGGERDE